MEPGCDDTTLLVYGRGSGNKADHTRVRFWSTDIEKAFAARGVIVVGHVR